MSGGSPAQNLTLMILIGVVAVALVLWVVIGRLRRARATGTTEAGSVRSRAQAKEIADRIHSFCSGPGASAGDGASAPRVEVLGAARLLAVLRADDRFDVTPRDGQGEYWSFSVRVPGGSEGLDQGIADILGRNGVTAVAPSST